MGEKINKINFDELLIVCETDNGNYAVRPMNWAGIWNKDGKIVEHINHIAIFSNKEDAEWYVNTKNAESKGLLLVLPCNKGDMVFTEELGQIISEPISKFEILDGALCCYGDGYRYLGVYGRSVFLTEEEVKNEFTFLK